MSPGLHAKSPQKFQFNFHKIKMAASTGGQISKLLVWLKPVSIYSTDHTEPEKVWFDPCPMYSL